MPDISKIKLPSGTTYDIKDVTARSMASGGIQLKGTTTTALTDECTTNPITINGSSYTAVSNDAVFYGKQEFVFDGTMWHEFGDMSGLGALALKDSVSATYTPAGSVSAPTFTGTQATITVSGTIASSVSLSAETSSATGRANVTPAGSVTTTYNSTSTGESGHFTTGGTVGTPTITVTPSTTSKYVASSSTGGGSVTAGTAASCTLPSLSATVSGEVLTIGWSAGSFTANTPTAVTLPSFSSQTIATGISSATSSQPSFTGTTIYAHHAFSGTTKYVAASVGTASKSMTGSYTPAGTISQPTFTGTQATITSD